MTDLKPCIRCERPIDRYAKLCVYCNWDQTDTAVPPPQAAQSATAYVPPPDNRARNRLLGAAGLAVLIIGAFMIGMFIHGADAKEVKPIITEEASSPENANRSRSNVTLVPIDASDPSLTVPVEQPITTAPALAPGQDPNDATALPSDQYAAAAAKVKEQQKAQQEAVDPRSLRGRAYEPPVAERPAPQPQNETEQAQPQSRSESQSQSQSQSREQTSTADNRERATPAPENDRRPALGRTEAYPEYKPLPQINVDRDTTARLILTVGADGRVKGIDITEPIPGETSKLIGAVQKWRFRPATENGAPVSARVAVTITLHGNE